MAAATTVSPKVAGDPTKAQTVQVLKPPPFRIVPIGSVRGYIKCLFYGIPGSGKTSLAGSAVDVQGMDDVLLVNCESGALSIETAEHIHNRHWIDQVQATNWNEVASIHDFLKAHCSARDTNNIELMKKLQARVFGYSPDVIDESYEDPDQYRSDDEGNIIYDENGYPTVIKARLRRYKTVILDSLTEVNAYLIYHLLGITVDTKLDADSAQETAGWDEYKKGNQMLQMLIRAYRDLPMNFIACCGTQYNQDENKVMHWVPSLLGKLANQVQGYFDIVGYLVVGKPKDDKPQDIPRTLWIQPIARFAAKSRLANFKDPSIPQPSMRKIMAIFRAASAPSKSSQADAETQ